MGKKGAALRAAKAERTIRTFTEAQLLERDRALLGEYRQQVKKEMDEYLRGEKKRIWGLIEEEWAKRTELLHAEDGTGGFLTMVTLLQSISCRILIEQFGWPPAGKRANRGAHAAVRGGRKARLAPQSEGDKGIRAGNILNKGDEEA